MIADQLRRSLFIAWKDLRIYYIKGPVVIFGILLPLFFFLAFFIGRDMSMLALGIALMSMVLWFSSTSISPVVDPWETRTGTLERLISSPVNESAIVLGNILASLVLGAVLTVFPVLIAVFALGLGLVNPLVFILGVVLAAFCFSAIGVLMAAYPTDSPANIMLLASMIKFPVIFISGIFIPLAQLPGWGKAIAYCSPLTYFADLTSHSFGGEGDPWLDIALLALFTVLFTFLAIMAHRRTMPSRI